MTERKRLKRLKRSKAKKKAFNIKRNNTSHVKAWKVSRIRRSNKWKQVPLQ